MIEIELFNFYFRYFKKAQNGIKNQVLLSRSRKFKTLIFHKKSESATIWLLLAALVYIKIRLSIYPLFSVCKASGHPDQVKGRWIEAKNSSQKKLEEVDSLIDKEIDVAYKRATKILKDNAALHKVLIDAMMKFQTIGNFERKNFFFFILIS